MTEKNKHIIIMILALFVGHSVRVEDKYEIVSKVMTVFRSENKI